MTRWTPLHRIPDLALDQKAAAAANELNARIDSLENERAAADKLRADFLDADPAAAAEPGLHHVGYTTVLQAAQMQALIHELSLRQDIDQFLQGPRQSALATASEQCHTEYAQARERVMQQLADLGFDVERDPWMGNLPERHPDVHAAREAARSAREHSSDRNMILANKAALQTVRAEIDQRRAAAVA